MREYLHPGRGVGLNKRTVTGGIGPVEGATKKYKVKTLYLKPIQYK